MAGAKPSLGRSAAPMVQMLLSEGVRALCPGATGRAKLRQKGFRGDNVCAAGKMAGRSKES